MAARLLFTTRPPSAAPGDNPFDVLDRSAHEGDEEMTEEPPETPGTPQANTPRTRQPATPNRPIVALNAKRRRREEGPDPAPALVPDPAPAPGPGDKDVSARCRAFDNALAEEREATSDKWEVLEKATQCLDAIVAAFDPGKSPRRHRLAKQLVAALDATILSHLKQPRPGAPNPVPATISTAIPSGHITTDIRHPATYADAAQAGARTRVPTAKKVPAPKPKPKPQKPDLRLFARLPANSAMRAHNAFSVAAALRKQLGQDKARALGEVQRIPTGFALVPQDEAGRAILQEASGHIMAFLGASALEEKREWATYIVQGIPQQIHSLFDESIIAVTEEMIQEEVIYLASVTPTAVRRQQPKPSAPDSPTNDVVVSFDIKEDPQWRGRIQLFGGTCFARRLAKKTTTT